jgi:hypothetical protein
MIGLYAVRIKFVFISVVIEMRLERITSVVKASTGGLPVATVVAASSARVIACLRRSQ